MPKKQYRDGPSRYSLLGTASTVGLHMVSAPAVGGFLGYGADKLLGSWPIGASIGFGLGVVSGFYMVWKDFKYLQRNEDVLDEKPAGTASVPAPRTKSRDEKEISGHSD